MANFGCEYPQFVISAPPGQSGIVSLPLTHSSGLIETYTRHKIQADYINLDYTDKNIETKQENVKYRIFWTLNYDQSITATQLKQIQRVMTAFANNETVYFYPRFDDQSRFFDVIDVTESYELGLRKGGQNADHYRFIMNLQTRTLVDDLQWNIIDPSMIQPRITTQQLRTSLVGL